MPTSRPREPGPTAPSAGPGDAEPIARRQLGDVLILLATLDTGVLVAVVTVAEARSTLRLSDAGLLLAIVAIVGSVIVIRMALAVLLRRRQGRTR